MTGSDTDADRRETDVKLQSERERTDEELLERSNALGEDADAVVQRARERASTVLSAGRLREDEALVQSSATNDVIAAVAKERANADAALLLEYSTADASLGDERARRLRALIQLLASEREQTDVALKAERVAADKTVETRDDVLAGVTHDLRAHLTTLLMSASSIILMRSTDYPIVDIANRMMRAVAQMEHLVADLLDVARMESGPIHVQLARVDLTSLVRNAIDLNRPAAQARSIDLAFNTTLTSLDLSVDAPRITRVLMNVLSNAIKFTPVGGHVRVHVERTGSDVEIAVTDTGEGIPSDQLEFIFERFRRADTTSKRPGYGLGLYIARAIVHAHRGRIWAENSDPHGAIFRIRLPST